MKNFKKLTASILIASLALFNLTIFPAYAKDENNTNERLTSTEANPTPGLDLDTLKFNKKTYKPDDTIEVSLKASHDTIGVNNLSMFFTNQNTSKRILINFSYNSETDLYEGSYKVGTYMINGTWSLSSVSYDDDKSNWHNFNPKYEDYPNTSFTVENDNADITGPALDLDSLKIDKKAYKSGESVKISIKASDDKSGIFFLYIKYKSPIKSKTKDASFHYNAETKLYEGTLDIDEYMENGTWVVDSISACDYNDNYTDYAPTNYYFSNVSFNVENDDPDVTAPTIDLDSLNVDKISAKTGETINISLRASDDKSGLSNQCHLFYMCRTNFDFTFVTLSYNSQTNLYTGKLNISSYMNEGSWYISSITVSDLCDNSNTFDCSQNYDLSNGDFTVDNDETDTVAPQLYLKTLKIDKNNGKPGDTITASLKAADDKSGIDYICLHYISSVTSKNQYLDLKYNPETNLYEGKFNIDTFTDNGTWSLDYISCSDNAGNSNDLYSSDNDFSKASFNVINDNADTTAPTIDLDSLKLDKKEVKAGDTLNVSLKASDDKSGIDYIFIQYTSESTSDTKCIDLKYNPQTDLYEGTLDIDTSMESGTWSLDYISCSDNAGNDDDIYSTDHDFSNFSFKCN